MRDRNEIIEFLLKKDPTCLTKTVPVDDKRDGARLPLHLAFWNTLNSNSVRFLFNLYPEAIMKPDDSGELPIDIVRNSIESGG